MRRPRQNVFSIERLYEDIRSAMPADCSVSAWTCQNPSGGFWPRLADAWRARRHQSDVNHVTGDVHYLTFMLDRRRTVLTVHDLVLLERHSGIKRRILWLLWYWLPVRRSCAVVTISESTRAALIDSTGCDPKKVHVIHNNVSQEFRPAPRAFDAGKPRILQLGTGLNKNLDRVAAALADIACRLVVIGPLSEAQRAVLRRHGIDHENHIGLSRGEMVAQYAEADLLVFASTYEGFGLPIIEAQATGRPVVTSNIPPMPEVAGDAACLIDPFDVESIRAGILSVIQDADYRRRLVEAGYRNVERFRVDVVAERYASLYRQIAARRAA